MNAIDTLETIKSGTSTLAETAGHAVGEMAGKAKQAGTLVGGAAERLVESRGRAHVAPRRRGRRLMRLAAVVMALGTVVKFGRGTAIGRGLKNRLLDLTGGRPTDEATVERLAAQGLDPMARGDLAQ